MYQWFDLCWFEENDEGDEKPVNGVVNLGGKFTRVDRSNSKF